MIAASTITTLCLLAATLHPPAAQAEIRSHSTDCQNAPSNLPSSQQPRYLTGDDIGKLGTEARWQIYMPEAAYRADQWNEQEARQLGRKNDLAAFHAINATYALVQNDNRNNGINKKEPDFIHRRIGTSPLTAKQTSHLNESRRASLNTPRPLTSEDIRTIMNSPALPDRQADEPTVLWNKLATAPSTPSSPQS